MKIDIYIHQCEHNGKLYPAGSDMSGTVFTFIEKIEIDYEIPANFNPTAQKIAALNAELDRVKDEYMEKTSSLKSRINDLQCIEHSTVSA